MRLHFNFVPACLFTLAASAAAPAAELSVAFVQPEHYIDAGYSHSPATARDRAEVQRDIERHLQAVAERRLADDEVLKIEVLDIDLAGRFEPFRLRAGNDVRIVTDNAWPRITLRYTLSRAGQTVVASAEERLTDMNFLMTINRYPSGDRLRYEKAMLDDWFDKRFAQR